MRYKNDEPIGIGALDFRLDLARPETMGGVVVVLLQPYEKQTYANGFTADVDACKSLRAIKELISVTSNHVHLAEASQLH